MKTVQLQNEIDYLGPYFWRRESLFGLHLQAQGSLIVLDAVGVEMLFDQIPFEHAVYPYKWLPLVHLIVPYMYELYECRHLSVGEKDHFIGCSFCVLIKALDA